VYLYGLHRACGRRPFGLRETSSSSTASSVASTIRSARVFVLKLNTEAGSTSRAREQRRACPSSARFFFGRHLGRARLPVPPPSARVSGLHPGPPDPNSSPIVNGANIGGNLEYFQNLDARISDRGIGRRPRRALHRRWQTPWNLESNYCKAGGQFDPVLGRQAPASTASPSLASLPHLPTGFRPSVGSRLSAPLRFEWGFPPSSRCPYEESNVFEFTIGNFF